MYGQVFASLRARWSFIIGVADDRHIALMIVTIKQRQLRVHYNRLCCALLATNTRQRLAAIRSIRYVLSLWDDFYR